MADSEALDDVSGVDELQQGQGRLGQLGQAVLRHLLDMVGCHVLLMQHQDLGGEVGGWGWVRGRGVMLMQHQDLGRVAGT